MTPRQYVTALLLGVSGCVGESSDTEPVPPADAAVEAAVVREGGADTRKPGDDDNPCSDDGFCRTVLPGVPPPTINGLFAASPTRTVASTAAGTIILWNGSAWSTLALGYGTLSSVWAGDPDHFWIIQYDPFAIVKVIFQGDLPTVSTIPFPDAMSCASGGSPLGLRGNIAISGTSESNVYLSAYCNGDSTGILVHGTPGVAPGDPLQWSTLWTGGPLGGVYAVSPTEAWAVGWTPLPPESSSAYVDAYSPPGYWGVPDDPGTRTIVVHVKNGVVEEETLDQSLGMCAQTVWSSGSHVVFVGGTCGNFFMTDDDRLHPRNYTTAVMKGGAPGASWAPLLQRPFAMRLWGFADDDVYLAGSSTLHWDGAKLDFVKLSLNGAPFGMQGTVAHGTSPNDFWIAGGNEALHRAQ